MTKIIVSDKNGSTDSSYHSLITKINSKYPIVVVSWVENFVFNDALLGLTDYVLICYCEYGWNYEIKDSHIWGVNKDNSGRYSGGDWDKFDDWVKSNPPKILFKRELLNKDVSDKVQPIVYPCLVEEQPIQSREEFNNRPISVMNYFGRSNENRFLLQGKIWEHASKRGFSICDNIYYFNSFMQHEQGEKWCSLHIPYYSRIEIANIMVINGMSKISISLYGAGYRCFRNLEAPVNSVMLLKEDDLSWDWDWIDGVNCIKFKEFGDELKVIDEWLASDDLYDVYVRGVWNCNNYRLGTYIPYLENKINNV